MKFKFFLIKFVNYTKSGKYSPRGKFLNKQITIIAADLVAARKQIYSEFCLPNNGWEVSMFWPV